MTSTANKVVQRMHPTRSPSSIPTVVPGDALDLSLSGSQLAVSRRPGSASPGKCFSRSVSVCVAGDGRGKRNTLDQNQDQNQHYLALFDSSDGHKKQSGLSRASPDRTTWNILDDQPRASSLQFGPRSTGSVDSPTGPRRRETGIALAATFTANNRSNKGAVGNSVTTILHNNYSEKPLTPKSSNQRPSFNNILKATANDEVSQDSSSLTKSQKNFSSTSSNHQSSVSPAPSRRREVTEEEAERFIQQVNQSAVTIQRWYRRHGNRQHSNQAALKRILASKRKEWEERTDEDRRPEQQRRDEDRKRIREEKARLARLAAIQELQQKRAQRAAEEELESLRPTGAVGRRKPPPTNNTSVGPMSPADGKAQNTESNLRVTADLIELSFRAISPASSNHRGSPCSQEERVGVDVCLVQQHQHDDRKLIRNEKARLLLAAAQVDTPEELQLERRAGVERRRKIRSSAGNSSPTSPTGVKATNTGELIDNNNTGELIDNNTGGLIDNNNTGELIDNNTGGLIDNNNTGELIDNNTGGLIDNNNTGELIDNNNTGELIDNNNTDSGLQVGDLSGSRAASPAASRLRGSPCSQEILHRSVSVEDQRRSKSTLTELLDTLKLLEGEEPERPSQSKSYNKEKYAWIDEDGDSTSLTTDNLERHGQLGLHPALPDGGALLSEAKLQSIMSFLDEMERSEQERPRSVTSGRSQAVEEEELAGVEQASATAAQVAGSMTRIKLQLEEKKRAVNMLQAALGQQRALTVRHVKETEKELGRSFQLQRDQYEATIQRHLSFIDQLIQDKKQLGERCEGVVGELQTVDHKYTKKISQLQEQHDLEIKKLKELMSATEKIRREKWIDEKTKKIKEITVKGLEPEIQKLISRHKQELKKLRTLHEAELLQADDRVAQRYVRQCEELRLQLEREKEEQCHRERELAKQRCEKQLQEEELSLQQQRRRLYKEVADEKERLAQLAARQRVELEDLRRQLEENSSLAGRALREELDKSREEQERRHQVEVKALQERLDIEKQTWEENYKKKEEAWLLSRERQLKEELRRGRDKEIELAIWTLEEETSKDKEACDRAADSRVKRVREKYEAELKELERSERTAVEKQQELRRQQVEAEGELLRLQAALRQTEQRAQDVARTRDKLVDERRGLAEVIRQEFAERLVATEEENRRVKVEVSEVRARLRLEVERVTREKEEELAEVHQRVKSAILKKEETVSHLRKQHEAAVKRADHLEALWEQQRKQLLEK
ncbi:centrosomal protein of 131 kDa [Pseudoliparis swirei]|uniref:centrosomal protein of 131 kDa n=1 Tax=Pseudoliparis swirei TaxID=2059687 RepID=UPI0024BE2E60|nr:centrosomal protein of 131 kDa [Pseudoliparis swirei]